MSIGTVRARGGNIIENKTRKIIINSCIYTTLTKLECSSLDHFRSMKTKKKKNPNFKMRFKKLEDGLKLINAMQFKKKKNLNLFAGQWNNYFSKTNIP